MRKAVFLLIAILSVSLFSGCVDNAINQNKRLNESVKSDTNVTSGIKAGPDTESVNANRTGTGQGDAALNLSDKGGAGNSNSGGANWCVPGSKVTVLLPSGEKEYTVIGITTYKGREVCQAEMKYENGTSVQYVSKDGKFMAMVSKASGNGSVYSEAKSQINSSG